MENMQEGNTRNTRENTKIYKLTGAAVNQQSVQNKGDRFQR